MKVLFITCYPSPYRVRFFDRLGKDLDVTVLFCDKREDQSHRDRRWFEESSGHFHWVDLEKRILQVRGESLCLDVISWLKKPWDAIVICGYSSPTMMLAMAWLRCRRIPFWMEIDGGLIRPDGKLKFALKKLLVTAPTYWLSSGETSTQYLVHYGAKKERVFAYPFTSLEEKNLLPSVPTQRDKEALRRELQIPEKKMVLSVGQFIPRKGFDVLLEAAASLDKDTGIYLVGGEPTEEYIQAKQERKLDNVHFVGFRKREDLARYYQAADVFVLPTREDIWGLVINEAMAYGLPVITTDRCVAGLELVKDGVNGYIVPVENAGALGEKISSVLQGNCREMGQAALETIRPYTIENMAQTHVNLFTENRK